MIALFLAICAGTGDWPEFRAHGGHVSGQPPLTWSETENVRWKTAIHGRGWSSPVILGEQIWLTTAPEDGKALYAVAINHADGKIIHDIKVFDNPNPAFCHVENSYASCTPMLEPGRVYVHFGSAGTACLDATTGKTLWERRDLPCDHWRSPGSSPIIFEDLLLLTFDGYDQQYVAALDKNTGVTRWKTERQIDFGALDGDLKKAYSTPLVIESQGKMLMISPAAMHTQAFDARTGKEVWRVKHGGMNAGGRPTLTNGLLIVNTADGGDKLLAIRSADHSVAWKYGRHVPKRATAVADADLLYLGADDGFLTCLQAQTGKEIWSERAGGAFWASPLMAGGRVYFFDRDGNMPVIAAGREYKLLARNKLDAGCWGTPAAVDNDLIIRTKTHLYCIGAGK